MVANAKYTQSQKDVGCFGCVFWIAVFVCFCILMAAGVAWVWDWAF